MTKSLTIELARFFNLCVPKEEKPVTKQSYSEARMKMNHTAYIELNEDLVKEYYAGKDYKTYKGYRLLAIDGSKIQVPKNQNTIAAYGMLGTKGKEIPMATISTAYDVLNNLSVNTYLARGDSSERTLMENHVEKIRQTTPHAKDLLIADRGYPSLYLFIKMMESGYDFVIRCSEKGFLNEVKTFAKSAESERLVTISLDKSIRRNVSTDKLVEKPKALLLRLVRIEIGMGKTEYLITSLTDKKEFTIDDLKEIYHLRWSIETYFNLQKNVFELENLSGKTSETVKQDYFARVLSSNLSSLLIEEAQASIENIDTNNPLKKRRKVNRSVAIGLLKDQMIDLLFLPDKQRKEKYDTLIAMILKFTVPIIKNRHLPRNFRFHTNCFRKKRKTI